jgi:probable F420-dependent oxidoreductase
MKVGITLPHLGSTANKENVIHVAKIAQQEGFDSVWVFERLLWPLKPQTPYPATPDGSLPTFYQNVFDPLTTLTFVAANTSKIALGTSIVDMLFHNPIILARRFATLDVLSEERAIAGFGIGWSKDEYQASNIPYENRGKRADEFIQVLKKIWTDDIVEFKGQYYNISESKIGPKPIQKPHIPIYLGGYVTKTLNRIANFADGWIADVSGPLEHVENSMKVLRDQASKANRNPNEIKVIAFPFPQITASSGNGGGGNERNGSNSDSQANRSSFTGTVDEIGGDILRLKQIGVDHIIFGLLPDIQGNMEKVIDNAKELSKFAR